MPGGVFISYRREDSRGSAGRIYDRLVNRLGHNGVYFDVANNWPGKQWIEELSEKVRGCDALVAVIGRNWLLIVDDQNKRRLENPEDQVRIEVATALDRKIKVFPVLVDGASMPKREELPDPLKNLVDWQATPISDTRFEYDVKVLVDALASIGSERRQYRLPRLAAISGAALAVAALLFWEFGLRLSDGSVSPVPNLAAGPESFASAPSQLSIPDEDPNRSITGLIQCEMLAMVRVDKPDDPARYRSNFLLNGDYELAARIIITQDSHLTSKDIQYSFRQIVLDWKKYNIAHACPLNSGRLGLGSLAFSAASTDLGQGGPTSSVFGGIVHFSLTKNFAADGVAPEIHSSHLSEGTGNKVIVAFAPGPNAGKPTATVADPTNNNVAWAYIEQLSRQAK
jgi:TIR domain